jgi:hypothetical protein
MDTNMDTKMNVSVVIDVQNCFMFHSEYKEGNENG